MTMTIATRRCPSNLQFSVVHDHYISALFVLVGFAAVLLYAYNESDLLACKGTNDAGIVANEEKSNSPVIKVSTSRLSC